MHESLLSIHAARYSHVPHARMRANASRNPASAFSLPPYTRFTYIGTSIEITTLNLSARLTLLQRAQLFPLPRSTASRASWKPQPARTYVRANETPTRRLGPSGAVTVTHLQANSMGLILCKTSSPARNYHTLHSCVPLHSLFASCPLANDHTFGHAEPIVVFRQGTPWRGALLDRLRPSGGRSASHANAFRDAEPIVPLGQVATRCRAVLSKGLQPRARHGCVAPLGPCGDGRRLLLRSLL